MGFHLIFLNNFVCQMLNKTAHPAKYKYLLIGIHRFITNRHKHTHAINIDGFQKICSIFWLSYWHETTQTHNIHPRHHKWLESKAHIFRNSYHISDNKNNIDISFHFEVFLDHSICRFEIMWFESIGNIWLGSLGALCMKNAHKYSTRRKQVDLCVSHTVAANSQYSKIAR